MVYELVRVTDVGYRSEKGEVIVWLTGRAESGERVHKEIEGTLPYAFVPKDYDIPDEPYILSVDDVSPDNVLYEGYDGMPLRKVTVKLPKHINNRGDDPCLTDHIPKEFLYEGDIPYDRRVGVDYGLSGYIRAPKGDRNHIGDIETQIDPSDVPNIEPRVMMCDIEAHPPDLSGNREFQDFVDDASQPITAITTYDSYSDEYLAVVLDREDLVNPGEIRGYLEDHWGDHELAEDFVQADMRLVQCENEESLLTTFIKEIEDKRPDVISGWNFIEFDHQYIINRLKRDEFSDVTEHRLSDIGTVGGYKTAQMIDGLPGFDMMGAYCFSGDTEVMTPDGVRNIKEFEKGDEVYTLNEDTHEVEIKPVVETHETKNKWGTLESHQGRSHDFKVTPNHRFYVSNDTRTNRGEMEPDDYSYREYRELSANHRPYKFPEHKPGNGERRDVFNLVEELESPSISISEKHGMVIRNTLPKNANEKIELRHGTATRIEKGYKNRVGKYKIPNDTYRENKTIIDEYSHHLHIQTVNGAAPVPTEVDMNDWLRLMGWYISEGCVVENTRLIISQKTKSHRQSIENLLDRMGLHYSQDDRMCKINGQVLAEWFSENCGEGSENKQIPEWVFGLHPDHLNHLLDALVDGDGTRNSDTSMSYFTVSDELRDDIAELGLLCGWKPRIRSRSSYGHIHEIYLSRQGGSFKKDDGESIENDETVYCITAQDNHTIMAGRNGKFSWIGQCDKMTFGNWRSKSLDYVSNEVLEIGKVEDVNIGQEYKSNRSRFLAYNIIDTQLLVAMDERNGIHEFFYQLADLSSIQIYDAFSEMRLMDGFILARREPDEILPSAEDNELGSIAGGIVLTPSDGVNEWVAVLDLKSLYPSIFITLNVSEETLTKVPGEANFHAPAMPESEDEVGGQITQEDISWDLDEDVAMGLETDHEGILPKYLKLLFTERASFKEKRNSFDHDDPQYEVFDNKQAAVKVVMNCFSGDTTIWTPNGPQNIKSIEVGDKVYSTDPETGNLSVKEVTDTTVSPNLYGEIQHIQNSYMDLKITENHKMLTEERGLMEYSEAMDIPGTSFHVPQHNPLPGKVPNYFDIIEQGWVNEGRIWLNYDVHGRTYTSNLPDPVADAIKISKQRGEYRLDDFDLYREYADEIQEASADVGIQYGPKHSTRPVRYDAKDFMELLGWYITGGFIHKSKTTECDRLSLTQKNNEGRKQISDLLNRVGLHYGTDQNGFHIGSRPLCTVFEKLCGNGSYGKGIPEFVFDLDSDLLSVLWETMVEGDGSRRNGHIRYSTASEQLKDDVCRLLIQLGHQFNVSEDSGVYRISPRDSFTFMHSQNTTSESHNGDVYCVTVADNHTVMAGRNGKYSWTGQSFYGASQNRYNRFSNPISDDDGVGSTITAGGRYVLWRGSEIMREMGYEVLYGDTDSVMIQLADSSEDVTPREVLERGMEVEEELNDRMDEVADEFGIGEKHPYLKNADLHGNDRHCLHWEAEKIYRRFLQAGTKKRYAGLPVWKEGDWYVDDPDQSGGAIEGVDPDITGFEAKRSDVPEIAAEVQEDVIKQVLGGAGFDEVGSYISNVVDDIKNLNLPIHEIANPGVLNKDLKGYGNTPTARACRYSNRVFGHEWREGDDPWIYYIKSTPAMVDNTDVIALEWGQEIPDGFEVDTGKIIKKRIKKPLEPVLGETGWTFDELKTGRKMESPETESIGNPFSESEPINENKNMTEIESGKQQSEGNGNGKGNDNNNDGTNPLSW